MVGTNDFATPSGQRRLIFASTAKKLVPRWQSNDLFLTMIAGDIADALGVALVLARWDSGCQQAAQNPKKSLN